MDYLPIVAVFFSVISLILMLILWKRAREDTFGTLEQFKS
ncbi:unnamed protein product, partial [marine sediment metagenome]